MRSTFVQSTMLLRIRSYLYTRRITGQVFVFLFHSCVKDVHVFFRAIIERTNLLTEKMEHGRPPSLACRNEVRCSRALQRFPRRFLPSLNPLAFHKTQRLEVVTVLIVLASHGCLPCNRIGISTNCSYKLAINWQKAVHRSIRTAARLFVNYVNGIVTRVPLCHDGDPRSPSSLASLPRWEATFHASIFQYDSIRYYFPVSTVALESDTVRAVRSRHWGTRRDRIDETNRDSEEILVGKTNSDSLRGVLAF